ncbi:hypothetical protein PHLGIDRAFT_181826 [Phlebiopsis gigantea 11061_1 CR5-6]|uniref:Uncharacterized protein n=1 Tax=Phlebiopsis gigantea (strain 11061_1 CR5-6) TaxID=745531 RepID=A0A0C3RUL1_PHLG1|nr:hypothetical protein PHLGIDRAFT_181826 [Phlebiopsis gigantea 11061_1 CR5-6]
MSFTWSLALLSKPPGCLGHLFYSQVPRSRSLSSELGYRASRRMSAFRGKKALRLKLTGWRRILARWTRLGHSRLRLGHSDGEVGALYRPQDDEYLCRGRRRAARELYELSTNLGFILRCAQNIP